MLTKATSLPQITLTDFDAEESGGDQVLFQEQWKRQKINVVLPATAPLEPLLKPQLSEESTDEHETEKGSTNNQKKPSKQNQKPSQKCSATTSVKKKVGRQYSLAGPASTQNAKPKVLSSRRSSLDTGTKSILIDERRGSLESSKASTLNSISKRLSQKAKSIKEQTSSKHISGLTKKVIGTRVSQTDEKRPVMEVAKTMKESIQKDISCKMKPEVPEHHEIEKVS